MIVAARDVRTRPALLRLRGREQLGSRDGAWNAQLASAHRVSVVMRIHAVLPTLGLVGVLATSAFAQTDDVFPPANAGCGAYGMTMSQNRPTVAVTSLRLTDTGRVRIGVRGNQTAATKVKIAQVGGMRVGGTPAGGYTCTRPNVSTTSRISVPLNAYGRKLVRRHGRLAVKVTFRLINGSGVTNTRVVSGVIKPE